MQTQLTKTQEESGDYYKEIWELDLFQEFSINDYQSIQRVPGGWLFTTFPYDDDEKGLWDKPNRVFIPYTNEFKPLQR